MTDTNKSMHKRNDNRLPTSTPAKYTLTNHTIASSHHHTEATLVRRLQAPLQAHIDILRQVGRDILPELLDVLPVNSAGESKRSIKNLLVQREEVLRNLTSAGILAVQRSHKHGVVTVIIELEVDAALREYSALELVQSACDLRVLASGDKAVFKDVAEFEVGALDEGEELGGAGMHVGSVDAAGLEEGESGADAKVGEDGESLDVCRFGCAAFGTRSRSCVVEGEDDEGFESVTCEESRALSE